ncbi:MAG: AI-2E family transporter [Thermoanaerobaculia bacterium]
MRRPDPAVLRLLIFLGGLLAVLVTLILLRRIVMPLLLGLAIAYFLDPVVSAFERRGRSRVLATVLLAVVAIGVVAAVVLLVVPALIDEAQRLAERFPQYREELQQRIDPWLERMRARYPQQLTVVEERLRSFLEQNLPRLAGSIARQAGQLFGSVFGLILFLLNLIFVPVFAFYLLVDMPKLKQGIRRLIPVPYRESVLARLREVDQALSSFVRGQLTIAIIIGLINGIGLTLLGVPLGFAVGMIAGLANMIPYMALVVGLVPALLLCWVDSQSWPLMFGVVAVFTGAQMLEGTVLSPRILGKSVQLHPVWVLLAVIVGGSLFGFFGMLIAVPTAAVIQVFVRHWLALYRKSDIYLGAETS